MIIKNYEKLATSQIRADALKIAEAGYESISIDKIIGSTPRYSNNNLIVGGSKYNLTKYKNIYVIALGKGTGLICETLENMIGAKNIAGGVAIDIKHRKLKKIKVFVGSHPFPTQKNVLATNKLIQLAKSAGPKDLVITIICGGGSALACKPVHKDGLSNIQNIYKTMMHAGADIQELNTVRKHVGKIHGGFLAQYIYPASVLGLVISDIPGDEIDLVASGPISQDDTTKQDALDILSKYQITEFSLSETPKDSKYFKKVSKHMLACGGTAVEGMISEAKKLGYEARVYSKDVQGEAGSMGKKLAQEVKPGEALLACGETTVVVTKPGKGGRNQDLALSALPHLPENSVIISAASDGKDNINVAGGIADSDSFSAFSDKLSPEQAIEDNQSFMALKKINGIYHIRKVTANVSDFIVVLRKG